MGNTYRIYEQQGVYFVTCTVVQWIDVFTKSIYSEIVVDSLRYCQQHKGLEILGWVIISNHIHLIISAKDGHKLSDILRDFKKYTSTKIVEAIESNVVESRKSWLLWLLKQNGNIQFWQEGYHAEEITSSKFFYQKLNYIHANPVRANIVDREDAYLYSSAKDYHGSKGLLTITYFD